ncbi:MAG: PQQ-binding-like beta-propeller repeat protein [Pirellulaceae bacterium]|nr:PQQ-binding-like beta-propeller repeat protein [Pirellulaceae bacterium]
MLRYHKSCLVLPFLLLVCSSAWGQLRRSFSGPTDYRRAGLEVAWTSQAELDRDRSAAANAHLQLLGLDSYEDYLANSYPVYEVKYDKGIRRFSAIDLGRDGKAIGDAEAARLAEKEKIRLDARGYQTTIEEKRVPRSVLYIQTNSGTVQAIDAENGQTLWAILVGRPSYQTLNPAANDKYVSVINGSSLYLLERETGEQVWKRSLQNNPIIGPVLTQKLAFAPTSNGQIEGHWLPSEDDPVRKPDQLPYQRPTWYYHSGSQVSAPITASPRTISWPTEGGRAYVCNIEKKPEVQYMVRTSGPIHGQTVFVKPDRLAVGSSDGFIYCLDEGDGEIEWQYATGEPIHESLFSDNERIYAITEFGNLHAVGSSDGFQQWLVTGIKRIVAASDTRLYVLDQQGVMHGLDPKTGGRVMSLDVSGYDLPITNRLTDRIYLAASDGTIQCLREIHAPLPTIHASLPQPTTDKTKQANQPASDSGASRDEFSPPTPDAGRLNNPAAGDDDPFGAGDADEGDPFGAGDGEDPFGAGDADEGDPFGAGDGEDPFGADDADEGNPFGAGDGEDPFG